MKAIIFTALTLLTCAHAGPDIMGSLNACIAEAGLTSATIEKIEKGDLAAMSQDEKCVLKCVLTKQNVLNPDGSFNEAGVLAILDALGLSADDRAQAYQCINLKGADECETAMMVGGCSFKYFAAA